MSTEAELESFFKKFGKMTFCAEYVTHYYEFDSNGRYADDWYVYYNDPQKASCMVGKPAAGKTWPENRFIEGRPHAVRSIVSKRAIEAGLEASVNLRED